jgi:arylsulfatase A-like enzyme/Flp pilus assembly protein TadD
MKLSRARSVGSIALCLLALVQRPALASPAASDRPNIILITVDTLRADRLGCYGYVQAHTPVIDKLAAGGFRFSRATAQVPLTLPSHYSILTGTLPAEHGVHDNAAGNPAGPPLVSQFLQKQGYQTAAFVSSYVLDSSFGLDRGFDRYSSNFDVSLAASSDLGSLAWPALTTVQQSIDWIGTAKAPFFVWIHFYDLHTPYHPPERFARLFPQSPYDAELAYIDSSIGMLLRFLGQKGLAGNTDIVLTADHGEGLGDHQEPGHGYFVYESTLHVPLVVYLPKAAPAGKVVERLVESIDIAPTLLRLAGLPPGPAMPGEELCELHSCAASPDRWVYFESLYPQREFGWAPLRGLKNERFKYIDAPRPELYDLRSDSGERNNIFNQRPAVAQEIKRKLNALPTANAAPQQLSPEIQKRLAALGYVSGAEGSRADPGKHPLKDPKDELPNYLAIASALQLVSSGQSQAAIASMESLLTADPGVAAARFILAGEYEKQGELLQAAGQYGRILEQQPANFLASLDLALLCARQGKFDDSVAWYRHALELQPGSALAHVGLGVALRHQGLWPQAAGEFQASLKQEPNFTALYNLAVIHLSQGQPEPALDEAQRALSLQPMNWQIFNLLGSVYLSQSRLQDAERSFRRALVLNPESEEARANLARLDRGGSTQ